MANASNKLEVRLLELGNGLAAPPSSADELYSLLDLIDCLLSRVEQSPSQSMLTALEPLMKALVVKELLRHSDLDVKVAVASCISEITRITAPEAPYEDDVMKEIFQMIVGAFERLDDMSSRSFSKRVSILETVAKVRSCVVMLDLECDALILEMFHHFLKTIRMDHSDNVFSSMETIMTLVIEESEDISSELLSCLLVTLKRDNKDVLPIARKLVEKVMSNCANKIKSCLMELVQSAGASLSEYNKVVASICQESSDALDHNETHASGEVLADDSKLSERTVSDELPQVSAKLEQEVVCPETVDTAADNSPIAATSNGTVQMGNGDSMAQPSSPKQKSERTRRSGKSKSAVAANQTDSDNLESVAIKPDGMSDLHTKKLKGRKTNSSVQLTDTTNHSRIDSDKDAPAVTSRRKGRTKEAGISQANDKSAKEVEPAVSLESEKKNGVQPSPVCENKTHVASPTPVESSLDSTRAKKGRPSGSKVASKRNSVNAVVDQLASVSASGRKDPFVNSQTNDEVICSKDDDSKKEPMDADDVEAPTTLLSDSEVKPRRSTGKRGGFKRKLAEPGSSGRKQKSNMKQKNEDVAEEPTLKELASSPRSASKAPSRDQTHLEESVKPKSRRKRTLETEDVPISETPYSKKRFGESLVGLKIKVWWPDDEMFYSGVVDSFDPNTKKHKIIYTDGDVEVLLLKEERWDFAESDTGKDGGKQEDEASVSQISRGKKAKVSSNSVSKQAKTHTQSKSGTESSSKDVPKPRGRPRGGASKLGKLSYDDSPRSSRKSRGKAVSDDKANTPKSGSKLQDEPDSETEGDTLRTSTKREEPGSNSKDETPKLGGKSKGDTSKMSGKSKDESSKPSRKPKNETPKASTKLKDDTPKASSKSKEGTLKTASKSVVDVETAGSKPKTQTPRTKSKIKSTPIPGGDSKENGISGEGKAKVGESENTGEKKDGEATTASRKHKRKGKGKGRK